MLYIRETEGSIDKVTWRVQKATLNNKFGVIETIDLSQKMRDKNVEFGPECRIVEVCNPVSAKIILESIMAFSTVLPCRISVYEEDGKIKIATLKPTAILGLFEGPEFGPIAADVEQTLMKIIDEAVDSPEI